MTCKLCKRERPLLDSHIIPSFVVKWLKDTSATSFLRSAIVPNLRMQDSKTVNLLCKECEQAFSFNERLFALKVFRPYCEQELDDRAIAKGKLTRIEYYEWLLRFSISVQWRLLAVSEEDKHFISNTNENIRKIYRDVAEIWRLYLIGDRKDTGGYDTHIIFLQSMSGVIGGLPDYIDDRIDSYLLRAIDATTCGNDKELAVFTKLGPIALYSCVIPSIINRMRNTRIHKKGFLTTVQSVLNPRVSGFIFRDRPKEVLHLIKYSDKQEEKIKDTLLRVIEKNPKKVMESYSKKAAISSEIIKSKKTYDA